MENSEQLNNNQQKSYQTKAVGSVGDLLGSNRIFVYNRNLLPPQYQVITIYNIDQVFEKASTIDGAWAVLDCSDIINGGKVYKFDHSKITTTSGTATGFNGIIYLSPTNNTPCGYTYLYNSQGMQQDVNIIISLSVKVTDGKEINLEIINSLASVYGLTDTGNELNEYTTSLIAKKEIEDLKPKSYWANDLRSSSPIYLPGVGAVSSHNYFQLGAIQGMKMDNRKTTYENVGPFNFGYLGDTLVLYTTMYTQETEAGRTRWGYEVLGASKNGSNMFGTPNCFFEGSIGMFNNTSQKILYGAGPYLVCGTSIFDNISGSDDEGEKGLKIFDMSIGSFIDVPNFCCIDPYDKKGTIRLVNYDKTSRTLFEYFPELLETLTSFDWNYSYKVIRKIGSWFILSKTTYVEGVEKESWEITSPYINVPVENKEDIDKFIFVSDKCLIKKETETKYVLYENNGYSVTVDGEESFLVSPFIKYRRGILPKDLSKVPNIVSGFGGLIFYTDEEKINLYYI